MGDVPLFDLSGVEVVPAAVAVLEAVPFEEQAAASTPVLVFAVRGLPGPQGSKRHVGNGRMIESSKKVKPWRADVVAAAVEAREAVAGFIKLDGPLRVDMVFCLDRPKGHMGTGRNAGLVRPSAPLRPHVKPDLSKLVRATEDALTTAGVYGDDALIVDFGRVGKWYTSDHGRVPDVLDSPGCLIRLWRVEPVPEQRQEAGPCDVAA
ncbi:RusA family crossover junction endodeoxyribonuclease [Streptomyces sp. H27-H5]|uniref:RusA family crossover junction endodeoxyribonuclease n=1 Tax=Streptomyces sp. H27-H5 TaxID=2996460 RepID=UPI00226EACEE|nr:RusA family crossover junction endodeoxyribonuclease [Streptomyces sp. H27-H5]MCY0957661.1 RusA family crossover junction endodeoxyribonuclease [Streptomyces sp. H27-H5]